MRRTTDAMQEIVFPDELGAIEVVWCIEDTARKH